VARWKRLLRRRPLVALIVLVLLLAIGYAIRAVDHRSAGSRPLPTVTISATADCDNLGHCRL
jgi:hypothetical protein